jgi:2-C-methyl-D-erythritol 4-phosphate cytidylyltransferase
MGGDIPKQFLLLKGRPVLMHTIEKFSSFDPGIQIIVVLPEEHIPQWEKLVRDYTFKVKHTIVKGGTERFYSVKAGLIKTDKDSIIAIHDGVRPLVSHDTIRRCFADAEKYGMAIPYIEPADSVRIENNGRNTPVARTDVRLIQTPQVFRGDIIWQSYECDYNVSFTDDASVAEASGHIVHLTEGNRENIKITTAADLAVTEAIVSAGQTPPGLHVM